MQLGIRPPLHPAKNGTGRLLQTSNTAGMRPCRVLSIGRIATLDAHVTLRALRSPARQPRRLTTSGRCFSVCALLSLLVGCAATRLSLPEGPGTPFPDYASLFETAVSECRRVRTLEAVIRLRGRGGGATLNGRVRAALAAPGSIRLEGLAPFGAPGFYLVARPGEATLWLTREARVLRDVPAVDMLESLTGVPFGPEDLRAVLTGCVVPDPQPTAGRSYGDWVVVDLIGGAVAYLRPVDGEYHVVAGIRDGLTIEYGEFRRRIPRQVRVLSVPTEFNGRTRSLTDLTATLSQVSLGVEISVAVFSLAVPADVVPMTLEELRRVGPLEAPPGPSSFD